MEKELQGNDNRRTLTRKLLQKNDDRGMTIQSFYNVGEIYCSQLFFKIIIIFTKYQHTYTFCNIFVIVEAGNASIIVATNVVNRIVIVAAAANVAVANVVGIMTTTYKNKSLITA